MPSVFYHDYVFCCLALIMARMSWAFCPLAAGFTTGAVAVGASSSSNELDAAAAGRATGASAASTGAAAAGADPLAGADTPAGRKYWLQRSGS